MIECTCNCVVQRPLISVLYLWAKATGECLCSATKPSQMLLSSSRILSSLNGEWSFFAIVISSHSDPLWNHTQLISPRRKGIVIVIWHELAFLEIVYTSTYFVDQPCSKAWWWSIHWLPPGYCPAMQTAARPHRVLGLGAEAYTCSRFPSGRAFHRLLSGKQFASMQTTVVTWSRVRDQRSWILYNIHSLHHTNKIENTYRVTGEILRKYLLNIVL